MLQKRKFYSILLVFSLLIGITACGAAKADDINELLALGAKYLLEEKYEEAIVEFDKAIAVDDKCLEAYVGKADSNLGMDKYEEAVTTFEEVVKLDEAYVTGYIGLADTYLFMEDEAGAIKTLEDGFEATKDSQLEQIISSIKAGTYTPEKLHLDYETLAGYEAEADAEEGEKLGARTERYDCNCDGTGCYTIDEYNDKNEWVKVSHYQSDGILDEYSTFEYNKKGQFIKENVYKADGALNYYITHEYNTKGERIKTNCYQYDLINGYSYYTPNFVKDSEKVQTNHYNSDGTLSLYWISEYNNKGEQIKNSCYEADGTLSFYWISEYNDKGEEIKSSCYEADGTLNEYDIYEYNDKGELIKWSAYSADGTLMGEETY